MKFFKISLVSEADEGEAKDEDSSGPSHHLVYGSGTLC